MPSPAEVSGGWFARVPILLRGALLLALLTLVIRGTDPVPVRPGDRVAVDGLTDLATARLLSLESPPAALVRTGTDAPGSAELERLRALAGWAPLHVALDGTSPRLILRAPAGARVDRGAALRIQARGRAGDTLHVRVEGDAGVQDSVAVVPGEEGVGEVVVRIRPVRAGWHTWTAFLGDEQARGGALVLPGEPLAVLALPGLPGWESRFLIRALEESGAAVTVRQPLGSGRALGSVGDGAGGAVVQADLDAADVTVVFPTAGLDVGMKGALVERVAAGGGLLWIVGAEPLDGIPGLLPARPDPAAPIPGPASALHWTAPAEVPPLPPLELEVAPVPLVLPGDAGWTVTGRSGPGGAPFAAARALGAGRVAVVGLPGSWLWRMEGGAVEDHRAFWRGWVDWAAGGVPEGPLVSLPAGAVTPGSLVDVDVQWSAAAPEALRLLRPDGSAENLPVRSRGPGRGTVGFVPSGVGVHLLGPPGGEPSAGLSVEADTPPAPDARALLAQVVGESGGRFLAPGGDSLQVGSGDRLEARAGFPAALLVLLGLTFLAAGEWTLRRLRGLP